MLLNRMLWLDMPSNATSIKERLTVVATAYAGEETVYLYEDRGELLGVPRMWGLASFTGDIRDDTVFPHREWPKILFCAGENYWPGQLEAIEDISQKFLLRKKFGALLEAHCGSGKTLVSLAVASNLDTPTLVLVHKEDLLDQWKDAAFLFFPGVEVGRVQGAVRDYEGKHITIATAQTLYSRRDEFKRDFWRSFGLVVYDEGHRYPARTFERVMRMPEARYRLAVSATWRRADGLSCVWNWHVGQVEHTLKTPRLTGTFQVVPWKTSLRDGMFNAYGTMNHAAYLTAISESAKFNEWLAEHAIAAAKVGRRVLLIGDRRKQLRVLFDLIRGKSEISVGTYAGARLGDDGKEVTIKKDELKYATKCPIILATYGKMSEGTDIPALDTLIFATPRADVEQVVGRVLRFCHGKKEVLVIDPVFSTRYMRNLAGKRRKTYAKLGFKERK